MRSLFEGDGGLKVRSLKSLEVQFQIQPADRAAAIDLKPIFGAKTVEDVSAGEPLDGLIFVGGGVPTANPSMQMVHFCLDLPIFMFLMSLRQRWGSPLPVEKVFLFSCSRDSLQLSPNVLALAQLSPTRSATGKGSSLSNHYLLLIHLHFERKDKELQVIQKIYPPPQPPPSGLTSETITNSQDQSQPRGKNCSRRALQLWVALYYIQMKKIGSEIRFENNYQTALQELQLLNKKPNKDRAESVKTLIKEMDRCITNIQQTLLGNSKINKKDAQNKVQLYKQQKKSVFSSLEAVELQLKQKQLFQYRSNNKEAMNDEQKLKYENRELALKLNEQVKTIHKTLNEAKTVTKDTVVELQGQRKVIENIDNQIEEAEGELSTINEFMSIISNRNLLTRLILFALILFLGAADLIIIILKIK